MAEEPTSKVSSDWLTRLGDFVMKIGFPAAVAVYLLVYHTSVMREVMQKMDKVIFLLERTR